MMNMDSFLRRLQLALLMCTSVMAMAQDVGGLSEYKLKPLKQRNMKMLSKGDYSGITMIDDTLFALVDDKAATEGFRLVSMRLDSLTGEIVDAQDLGYRSSGEQNSDMEDIAFMPSPNGGTLFVASESTSRAREYTLGGSLTGRELSVPVCFEDIQGNRGLESLTYNNSTGLFWATSESTLRCDVDSASPSSHAVLRLQSFDRSLQPLAQYRYMIDEPGRQSRCRWYTQGVSALCALDDGALLVLEREVMVPRLFVGSRCVCKIYLVRPRAKPSQVAGDTEAEALPKMLLASWTTKANLTRCDFANYEGMCLGPRLADGSRTLLLVADSQHRYKGVLKDFFKVIRF